MVCGSSAKVRINDICSYTSPRIVRIRDWRLGSIYFALITAIFCYVVIYSVVIEQRYRVKAVDLVGSTRLQLHSPASNYSLMPSNLSYCTGGPPFAPTDFQYAAKFPCRFYDQYDAVDPGLEPSAMFVSTRITETNYSLPEACRFQPDPTCQYQQVGNSSTYYIGNVEMFTLLIDHTFSSATLGMTRSAMSMHGKLVDSSGNTMDPCAPYAAFAPSTCDPNVRIGVADGKHADIMPLRSLLSAGGIASMEAQGGSLNETHRQAGTVLVVSITYSNYYLDTGSFSENYFTYTYSVASIDDAEFKYEQNPSPGIGLLSRTILDRHGIRLIIKQAGNIGQFDVLTLIISLTSSLGLLAVASVVVDFLATRVMPLRYIYTQYKQVESVDFERLSFTQEELRRFKHQDLVNPKPRFLKTLKVNGGASSPRTSITTAALLAEITPSDGEISSYGLGATINPYGYQAPTIAQQQQPRQTYQMIGEQQRHTSFSGPAREYSNTGPDRRGSGISLKNQQARPLPTGPPPAATVALSRESSGVFATGPAPHYQHTSQYIQPSRVPFASIASGDGSESDADLT